jgi:hypothetical protein
MSHGPLVVGGEIRRRAIYHRTLSGNTTHLQDATVMVLHPYLRPRTVFLLVNAWNPFKASPDAGCKLRRVYGLTCNYTSEINLRNKAEAEQQQHRICNCRGCLHISTAYRMCYI